ncbi:unnamed protein product [Effrenium voratum]|uniref:Uncharacterized protein n=1 Tax=Effrenium voratum TaxID=2562239 RepID=A0AA36IVN0_9DINO|nr:unnamed protein product [Effrenium voratum]CAJ1438414.1 unnamed protein product [Effrenium voratum]
MEARGKSNIGCAQLAQLEQAMVDTTALQQQADAALERIARQQTALKRMPVTCPSCGTLNVPSRIWGAGDLVPCQECSQPFLPLSNSFQDSDLAVLRVAVRKLRDQAEQIQYLECLAKRRPTSRPTSPASPARPKGLAKAPERSTSRTRPGLAKARDRILPM